MSQSRELQLHIAQLEEIRSILNSMKNLARIEIHKLARFQTLQGQAVANIEQAALDFLDFYPASPGDAQTQHFCILLGAERGFCGDFNESLIETVAAQTYTGLIAVGSRLGNRLVDNGPEAISPLDGANVAEEVPAIIDRLIDKLTNIQAAGQQTSAGFQLSVVYHDTVGNRISHRQILPPSPQQHDDWPHHGNPPVLNLEPAEFFAELAGHYLFAVLHEIYYISLMAENHQRLQHLEAAVNHLDDETVNLHRKSQIYRQEEITEEIEVILLNSESPTGEI